jgi:hypothetical protein
MPSSRIVLRVCPSTMIDYTATVLSIIFPQDDSSSDQALISLMTMKILPVELALLIGL